MEPIVNQFLVARRKEQIFFNLGCVTMLSRAGLAKLSFTGLATVTAADFRRQRLALKKTWPLLGQKWHWPWPQAPETFGSNYAKSSQDWDEMTCWSFAGYL